MTTIAEREAKIIAGEQAIFSLEQAIDGLREALSDRTSSEILADEYHRLVEEQNKLSELLGKVANVRARQLSKVEQYSHLIAAE